MKHKVVKTPQKKQKGRPAWFFLAIVMTVLILLAVLLNWLLGDG